MNVNSFTAKLPIVNSDCVCILSSEWDENNRPISVKLLLVHDNQGWSGQFQISGNEDLLELIDHLSLTEEKYLTETKRALTTHGGADSYIYSISNNTFTWKKYVSKDMSIKFGCAAISQIPVSDVFERIIEISAQNNIKNNADIIAINKKNEDLEKENIQLKIKLDELIEMKNEMEKTLYAQFLCLLNEKKKKIVELKNKLEPVGEDENSPDAEQSATDPFNTDTDIDSEEDDQYPSKANQVKQQGSIDMEEEALPLPKRTRQCQKTEPTAGPSGVSRQTRNSKLKNNTIGIPEKTKETKRIQKKSLLESCVLGKIAEERFSNNSEEDAFKFPKRSKRTINNTNSSNQVKPSNSKIKYESDDETFLDKAEEMENDVDKTQSQIDLLEISNLETTIKTEQNKELTGVNNIKTNKELQNSERKEASKALSHQAQPQFLTDFCQGFSSATVDMLNQLI